MAADLPLRGTLPAGEPPAAASWTGPRIGIEAGFVRGEKQTLRLLGTNPTEQGLIEAGGLGTVAISNSSFVAGGGLGYDLRLAPGVGLLSGIVVGADVDLRDTNLQRTKRAEVVSGGAAFDLTGRQTLDYLGTVRGRLGYAFGRVLVYGSGGFAYGEATLSGKTDVTSPLGSGPLDSGRRRGIEIGTVYGGGVEALIPSGPLPRFLSAGSLSVRIEYLRYDLGGRNVPIYGTGPVYGPGGATPLGQTAVARFNTEGQFVSAGLQYRFSGGGY